jgi:hypothetical protein
VVGKVEIDRSSQRIDQFMSGKQSTPSVDGSVVRKVVTTCRTGETAVATEAKFVRQANGFFRPLVGEDSRVHRNSRACEDRCTAANRSEPTARPYNECR